jgi:hypothetical protein
MKVSKLAILVAVVATLGGISAMPASGGGPATSSA